MQNFGTVRKSILFGLKWPNLGIFARNLENKSKQKIPNFPSFEILGCFGPFCNFFGCFGWFWLFLAGFGSFWPVLGFSKYSSPIITRTQHEETKKSNQREKYCLLFHLFKCVLSKHYKLGRTSSLNC